MPIVKFTSALRPFFPNLKTEKVEATSIMEVLEAVNKIYPGIIDYLLEEDQSLRKHVNIFVEGELISNRLNLKESLNGTEEVYIFQALSGG